MKNFRGILAIILSMALILTFFVSCGEEEPGLDSLVSGVTPNSGEEVNEDQPPKKPTEGIEYEKYGDYAVVCGIGTATDMEVVIASEFEGVPVKSINNAAFRDEYILSIYIPDSVTEIGQYSFSRCKQLKSVRLSEKLEKIGERAFRGCTSLERMTIPASLTEFGVGAVAGCTHMITLTVAEGNPKYRSEGNCIIDIEKKEIVAGCNMSTIPTSADVTAIGHGVFEMCIEFTVVEIPDNITVIESEAFFGCTRITELHLSKNLELIGDGALSSCISLAHIYFDGTRAEWNKVKLDDGWDRDTEMYEIHCTDD